MASSVPVVLPFFRHYIQDCIVGCGFVFLKMVQHDLTKRYNCFPNNITTPSLAFIADVIVLSIALIKEIF